MGFAAKWLAEKSLFPRLFEEIPDDDTGIVAVVPAYNEPGITTLLDSLASCNPPRCRVEIIIIVNLRSDAGKEAILNHRKCIENINIWVKENPDNLFRLLVFDTGIPEIPGWGVGLARKTGMDEAVRRFDSIDRPEGVIVCLDADCKVEKNYFEAIAENLLYNNKNKACSIYFEHLTGESPDSQIARYIIQYELHLRYYLWALKFAGFPDACHTVGSAIAVKALSYIRAGGMNRRQAGEDFYFIQKLIPAGGYFTLNSTTVYPSSRESLRVPFGTGAAMSKLMREQNDEYLTYNFDAFTELAILFSSAGGLYYSDLQITSEYYQRLPPGLRSFINEEEWLKKINEIKSNTSGHGSFTKRFFGWFNMFRIVKYLNHVHDGLYEKQPVTLAALSLLRAAGQNAASSAAQDLLNHFRMLDKNS